MMNKKAILVVIVALLYLRINREDSFDPATDVQGKNVIVTGASSGIGEQIAYQYAKMGANVFITARREDRLKQVVEKCKKIGVKGAKFGYLQADMEMYEITSSQIIQDAVKLFGGLDHMILNHAYIQDLQHWEGTEKQLRMQERVLDINLLSYIYLTSEAMPYLRKSVHGRIGVTSSLAGKLDSAGFGPCSAAKFALDGFFSALRQELHLKQENISVTLFIPGFIATEAGKKAYDGLGDILNINPNSFIVSTVLPMAEVNTTALEMIKSVCRGDRELYYPPVLGSRYLAQMMPVIRHLLS